jgi:hypothetical protein
MIGVRIAGAVNLASWANKVHLPLAGGVLDQDAWFMSAWSAFENDVSKIEEDKRSRK